MPKYVPHDELFSNVKKLISENPEQKELIKKAIISFLDEHFFIRDHYCDLCDKRLTDNEMNSISPHDFLITCHQHREHAKYFQAALVRKKLGLPERTFFVSQFIEQL